jgi:hypothetical protein
MAKAMSMMMARIQLSTGECSCTMSEGECRRGRRLAKIQPFNPTAKMFMGLSMNLLRLATGPEPLSDSALHIGYGVSGLHNG